MAQPGHGGMNITATTRPSSQGGGLCWNASQSQLSKNCGALRFGAGFYRMLSCYHRPGAAKAHGVRVFGDVRKETLGRIRMVGKIQLISLPALAALAVGAAATGALAAAHGELDGIKNAASIYLQDV